MEDQKKYIKIGNFIPDQGNRSFRIEKGVYGQGYIFKDEEAYERALDLPCYAPELTDACYTHKDFLAMCNWQEDFARMLFDGVSWQPPGMLLDEMFESGEWGYCPN